MKILKRSYPIHLNKTLLRDAYLAARRQHDSHYREEAAENALEHLSTRSIFKNSYSIACYLATKYEFDVLPIIKACWEQQKQVYLPIIIDHQQPVMEFALYREGDSLKENDFGIMEPHKDAEILHAKELDLAIVPLVAFDRFGHRLGMGGGFYDHLFDYKLKTKKAKPFILGASFANQESDVIPNDEWDVMLDGVVTEKELLIFSA